MNFLAVLATCIPTKPSLMHNRFFDAMRLILFKASFKKCGKEIFIRDNVRVFNAKNFSIGNRSGIGLDSKIYCDGEVIVGDNVLTGPDLVIHTAEHKFNSRQEIIKDQGSFILPVEICDDVYIGSRVLILPGVKIGKGAVIGAGAVVTRNIPEYAVAVGVPARVLRYRS
jgi:maltose O-acetyltransferase